MSKRRDEMDQNSDLLDRAEEIGEKEGGPKMNPTLQLTLQGLKKNYYPDFPISSIAFRPLILYRHLKISDKMDGLLNKWNYFPVKPFNRE